jgi:tetratricopeptide (TPR) repeat protein
MNRFIALLFTLMLSANVCALPPEVEADRLILQAVKSLKEKDYETSVTNFEKAEKLNVKMPEAFYYHFGSAYTGAKKWGKARAAYEKYLDQTGTRGKFYREALEAYNQADAEYAKDKTYSDAMAAYEVEMATYKQDYQEYRRTKDKCDYAMSTDGRREACEKWAGGMKYSSGGRNTFQDMVDTCMQPKANAWFPACDNVPDRPVEPKKPTRK